MPFVSGCRCVGMTSGWPAAFQMELKPQLGYDKPQLVDGPISLG